MLETLDRSSAVSRRLQRAQEAGLTGDRRTATLVKESMGLGWMICARNWARMLWYGVFHVGWTDGSLLA